jgi:inner membrane protein
MDNLTHSLTGLALSRAGLNRGLKHPAWLLLLAANAPDIDVVTGIAGAAPYLDHHRGLTHSFLLLPVMALLPVVIMSLFSRGERYPWGRAYLASCIGVLSHVLLDWTNVYGVRLLAPLTWEWYRLDITHVVDLWLWTILLLSFAGPLISRLVSSEIGAKPSKGTGAAIAALALMLLYDGSRYVLHQRAIATLEARIYQGEAPSRTAAFPHFANPLLWTGLVEGESFYSLHDLNLLLDFDPGAGQIFYKPELSQAIQNVGKTEPFRVFLEFSQFPLFRMLPAAQPEGAFWVDAMDLRFGPPSDPRFVASALVDSAGRVLESKFTFDAPQR